MRKQIDAARHILSETEIDVLQARFGLGEGPPRSIGEIAGEHGITGEEVRQLERTALRKLHPNDDGERAQEQDAKQDRMREKMRKFGTNPYLPMSAEETKVLELSYGLTDGKNWAPDAVATQLGITSNDVPWLIQSGFRKLVSPDHLEELQQD